MLLIFTLACPKHVYLSVSFVTAYPTRNKATDLGRVRGDLPRGRDPRTSRPLAGPSLARSRARTHSHHGLDSQHLERAGRQKAPGSSQCSEKEQLRVTTVSDVIDNLYK